MSNIKSIFTPVQMGVIQQLPASSLNITAHCALGHAVQSIHSSEVGKI